MLDHSTSAMTGTAPAPDATRVAVPPAYVAEKTDLVARLHRVEGQVRGLARMVEQERYCIDVLTQISAATRALQEVALGLLSDHVRHCVHQAARCDAADAAPELDELDLALRRTMRI